MPGVRGRSWLPVRGRMACHSALFGVPQIPDVFFQLAAEQHLISCFISGPVTDEDFSGGQDVTSFRGEADVCAPAVPGWFLGQKPHALKPPDDLAHALRAYAKCCCEIGDCGGFECSDILPQAGIGSAKDRSGLGFSASSRSVTPSHMAPFSGPPLRPSPRPPLSASTPSKWGRPGVVPHKRAPGCIRRAPWPRCGPS